jgi:DNA-binding transcriptional MerR regulator
MENQSLSMVDVADQAGVSRRLVRYYVEQKLLQPAHGAGKGRYYDRSHVERLQKIQQLQAAGYSLVAIRAILEGKAVSEPSAPTRSPRPAVAGEWLARFRLFDGVELQIDPTKFELTAERIDKIRTTIATILRD